MPLPFRNESAEAGRLLKPVPRQLFRGNGHEVERVLKLREFADHRAQQRRVVDGGRTNPKHFQVENFARTRFQCKTGWRRFRRKPSFRASTTRCRRSVRVVHKPCRLRRLSRASRLSRSQHYRTHARGTTRVRLVAAGRWTAARTISRWPETRLWSAPNRRRSRERWHRRE